VVDVHGNSRPQELPVQELIIFGGWVSVGVSLFQGMALEEMESGGEFLNDMCALDIDKLEWRRITPRGTFLPEPRAAHSACVTGRRMLVFGGQSQYEPVNELLEFQLDLCIWRRVQLRGSNPSPRSGHCCLMIDHGKRMLVFGGFDGEIALHDLYVLDTSTFIWTQIDLPGGHPLARSGAACAMMGPTRMYMMGGYCKVRQFACILTRVEDESVLFLSLPFSFVVF
jgi:N-acetylneuraminic acid mutarotase